MRTLHVSTARHRLDRSADREALSAERIAAIVATVLIHIALLVGLRAAMVQRSAPADAASDALQVVILRSQPAVPFPRQTNIAGAQRRTVMPSTSAIDHGARGERSNRIQPSTPSADDRLIARIYNPDGSLRLAVASGQIPPRDLLAHRDVDHFLPGASDGRGPDFHVQDDPSPRDVLVSIGQCITAAHCMAIASAGKRGLQSIHIGRAIAQANSPDPCRTHDPDRVEQAQTDPERWMHQCGER